jgi:hypothetical protein
MRAESKFRLVDQSTEHDLIELLVVAVSAVLSCIPSHDTFGRVFAAIDLPAWWPSTARPVVGRERWPHPFTWSAPLRPKRVWCSGSARQPRSRTRRPPSTLALQGSIVTIAMGTQPNIAQAIRDRGADYLLAVKDNQPKLAESIDDFFRGGTSQDAPPVPQSRRIMAGSKCVALDCLHAPERWPDLTRWGACIFHLTLSA